MGHDDKVCELESALRAIASRHARDAVCPIGSARHPGEPAVMQEKVRAEEVIFYAMKEAFQRFAPSADLSTKCETPRCDAAEKMLVSKGPYKGDWIDYHFAVQLERELIAARSSARATDEEKNAAREFSAKVDCSKGLTLTLRHEVFMPLARFVRKALVAPNSATSAQLRHALEESVKLQSHYASLLNMQDGGERMTFTADSWIERLAVIARAEGRGANG